MGTLLSRVFFFCLKGVKKKSLFTCLQTLAGHGTKHSFYPLLGAVHVLLVDNNSSKKVLSIIYKKGSAGLKIKKKNSGAPCH